MLLGLFASLFAELMIERLRRGTSLSFRDLVADAGDRLVVVARFLALLELYREAAVSFEQLTALGELTVRWVGSEVGELAISDEFDGAEAAPTGERENA